MDAFGRDVRWGPALTVARVIRSSAPTMLVLGALATVVLVLNLHHDHASASAVAVALAGGAMATTLVWGVLAAAGWGLKLLVEMAEQQWAVREELTADASISA